MSGKNTKVKYFLAKSWKRVLARFFDIIFVTGIVTVLFVMFVCINPENPFSVYRFFGWTVCSWVVNIIYFILIPFFCKGRTLFLLAFGLKYVDLQLNSYYILDKIYLKKLKKGNTGKQVRDFRERVSYFFNLFKKEVILSQIPCFLLFTFGLVIISLGQDEGYQFMVYAYNLIYNFKEKQIIENQYYSSQFASVFVGLYTLYSILMIFIVINTIINSESRSFNDKISGIVTIDLRAVGKDENKSVRSISPVKKNYDLPGEIVGEALEEITE